MDKKDIYEHLAKIYLDASSRKKKKTRGYPKVFKNPFFISLVFVSAFAFILFSNFQKKKALNCELALVLLADTAKINFHFDPARKETYTIHLNKLNLMRFRALAFSVKKANYENIISLRVEFTTPFRERSEIYFKDVPHKWQDYKINLYEFKGISDWSEMSNLTFAIEEWNVKEKRGVVYIDNVRLLR
jgi:hypothetical protein